MKLAEDLAYKASVAIGKAVGLNYSVETVTFVATILSVFSTSNKKNKNVPWGDLPQGTNRTSHVTFLKIFHPID